ncbi:hypothetical protein [Rubritalea tangerina]|uniref:Uncharacterized protein n=1 Tax=Rubritalea tangerina TaxID=430798 RepID=A0ABW4ZEC1_9BACT
MRQGFITVAAVFLGMGSILHAQGREGRSRTLEPIGVSQLRIGEEGVVWHATWEEALKESKRSNRPLFFMAAACQVRDVSGVF